MGSTFARALSSVQPDEHPAMKQLRWKWNSLGAFGIEATPFTGGIDLSWPLLLFHWPGSLTPAGRPDFPESSLDRRDSRLVHSGKEVAVHVVGHPDARVPHHFLYSHGDRKASARSAARLPFPPYYPALPCQRRPCPCHRSSPGGGVRRISPDQCLSRRTRLAGPTSLHGRPGRILYKESVLQSAGA